MSVLVSIPPVPHASARELGCARATGEGWILVPRHLFLRLRRALTGVRVSAGHLNTIPVDPRGQTMQHKTQAGPQSQSNSLSTLYHFLGLLAVLAVVILVLTAVSTRTACHVPHPRVTRLWAPAPRSAVGHLN